MRIFRFPDPDKSRGEQKAKPGDYGYSASYDDVLQLRERFERIVAAANKVLEDCRDETDADCALAEALGPFRATL